MQICILLHIQSTYLASDGESTYCMPVIGIIKGLAFVNILKCAFAHLAEFITLKCIYYDLMFSLTFFDCKEVISQ